MIVSHRPWFIVAALAAATPLGAQAVRNDVCLACHAMANLGYREPDGSTRRFVVSPARFGRSVHARLACVQCHAGDAAYPHDGSAAAARPTCASDCHATDSTGHPYTHARQAVELRASVHGRADDRDNPGCLTCHGAGDAHAVTRIASAPPAVRMASCVGCHDDARMMARSRVSADAVASYRRSFHYKAIRFGGTQTAGCSDCHTSHRVMRPDDPRSSVARPHLAATCGRSGCHPGAQLPFAGSGANHLDLRVAREPVLLIEERLFLMLTAGTLAMLLVGIVLDIQKKFGWPALARRVGAAALAAVGRGGEVLHTHFGRLRSALARSRRATLRAARLLLYE